MATVIFAYDHSRDPMSYVDLADKIAANLSLTSAPQVDITNATPPAPFPANSIIVRHPAITEANRSAIQTLINAYVLDSVRASLPEGNLGTLMNKARQAISANNAFLAIANPTAAQVATQTKLNTRTLTALINLALNDATDTTGT